MKKYWIVMLACLFIFGMIFILYRVFQNDISNPSIPYTAEKTQANLNSEKNLTEFQNTNSPSSNSFGKPTNSSSVQDSLEPPSNSDSLPEIELAHFSTPLSSVQNNRHQNIELTVSILDGFILAPGEIFSFNQLVGKPSSDRGYKEADVFVNGEKTQGIGGRKLSSQYNDLQSRHANS